MSAKSATLAKSLHTVSALVAVGRYLLANGATASPAFAVNFAADVLGYGAAAADPYGLIPRAVAILKKDAQ